MQSTPVAAVRRVLEEHGWSGHLRALEMPVPTAAAAAEALGCELGAVANSLVFEADSAALLVLASGARRVDVRHLARVLGTGKICRASPDVVFEQTGQRVGGVAPVGHPRPIRTVVDVSLAQHEVLWAGAGDEHTMFSITYDELVALTGGTPVAVVPG